LNSCNQMPVMRVASARITVFPQSAVGDLSSTPCCKMNISEEVAGSPDSILLVMTPVLNPDL